MRYLLDTHVFLWWLGDDRTLSAEAREAIAEPRSLVHVSAASVWEVAIKLSLGRIEIDGDLVGEIGLNGFFELPMTAAHAATAGCLPPHHRDPFDRMLVAQAMGERLTVITRDRALAAYDISVLRA